MRLNLYIFLFVGLFAFNSIKAQDIYFSYYQFAPLNVNPAFAGAFSGSYRISGIYSDKGPKIANYEYKSYTLSADAPIMRGIRKQDWIGVGLEIDNTRSGFQPKSTEPNAASPSATQIWGYYKVGLAYHLALDKKQTRIFTLGAQYSSGSRKYAQLKNVSRVEALNNGTDRDLEIFNNNGSVANGNSASTDNKVGNSDIILGMLFNARNKTSDLKLGFAVEGITSSRIGVYRAAFVSKDSVETKPLGITAHGAYEMEINKRVKLTPGFYLYTLGGASAFNVNSQVSYHLDPEKDLKLIGGLGVRNLRSVILYAGAEIKDIKVGLAFDVDINEQSLASGGFGGLEICASYMGKIYKKPKVKPVIFCPRL